MSERLFGTDGIRAKAGEEPLTTPTLSRLGRVLADQVLSRHSENQEPRVLMGHDGRESGESIVAAMTQGLNQGGVHVDIVGLAPTPSVAYLTATGPYAAGVVVSASHNPAQDNGVKLLGRDGAKLADEVEKDLEEVLLGNREFEIAAETGEARRTNRMLGDYVSWLRNEAFPDLSLKGWKVALDCANGAYSKLAPRILQTFGAETFAVHDHPDGHNINDQCGALFPEIAAMHAEKHSCDIGLSVDGDGDRGLLVDRGGRVLDGDSLLAGLGTYLGSIDRLQGRTVVGTVMSNLALQRYLKKNQIELHRTPVGDRHVASALRSKNWNLGGEKSGHILFGEDHGFRGDGMYTFLRTVEAMQAAQVKSDEFVADYQDVPQKLLNLPVTRRLPMEELRHLQAAQQLVEAEMGNQGRVVNRFSGTELRLRLMVEALHQDQVDRALEVLSAAVAKDGILAEPEAVNRRG